jgi:D-serine deaminase-like pyridoxal phosphate-dependent protein
VFQGASQLTLDGKGRVSIPSRHRDVLAAQCDGRLTLTRHPDGCLLLYPRPVWEARREASRAAMAPLMETRRLLESAGLPVEIVAGGSTGTSDIDVELPGLTELQAGSYCVMDIDYRRIGSRTGEMMTTFEMALTVVATVVSIPEKNRAIVDAGLKAFSTDKPFPPESVERPGLEYAFAGDEHGRLTLRDPDRPLKLGERIEFFPPHCDPTINLYNRLYAVRGSKVEGVWEIAARGRSD